MVIYLNEKKRDSTQVFIALQFRHCENQVGICFHKMTLNDHFSCLFLKQPFDILKMFIDHFIYLQRFNFISDYYNLSL